MKVLTVVCDLEKGGTQRAAQIFAQGYKKIELDSRVLAIDWNGPRYDELIKENIQVYKGVTSDTLMKIMDWRPEVVHIHSHDITYENINTIIECFDTKPKIIETNVFSKPTSWSERIDVSFQLSNWCYLLYQLRNQYKTQAKIIPYPVITENFSRPDESQINAFRQSININKDDILLGRIGQSIQAKWSTILIDVFESLRKYNTRVKLLMVNPPYRLRQESQKSPYRDSITIIDQIIGDTNLSLAYSSIDIFLHIAEQGESFGMVLAESLLCQTPVVTLSTPWADNSQGEVIGNFVGGVVCTTKKGLIEAVSQLILDKDLRVKLGVEGRKRILQKYDYKKLCLAALSVLSTDRLSVSEYADITFMGLYANSFDRQNKLVCWLVQQNSLLALRLTLIFSFCEKFTRLMEIGFRHITFVINSHFR